MGLHHRAEMREIFARALEEAERGRLRLRVPSLAEPLQKRRDMHFHFKPEIFLQLHGRTVFRFPRGTFELHPGEICVMPARVPHGEVVYDDAGGAFRNLVAGFYSNTLSLHFAHEASPRRPDIEAIEFFDAPNLDAFVTLSSSLVQTYHMQAPARDQVLKGLLMALLGMFQNIVETGSGSLNGDIGKVFQTKWLVREQLSNPNLGVKDIAAKLQCSADYLSHLFHEKTGEKLIHYIQRLRIDSASLALETTALQISEIAYATGFSDPAYFARVFRQHSGLSPQAFRSELERRRAAPEAEPKTVYFDRLDYTYGPAAQPVRPASGVS